MKRSDIGYYSMTYSVMRRVQSQYSHGDSLNLEQALYGFNLDEYEKGVLESFAQEVYQGIKREQIDDGLFLSEVHLFQGPAKYAVVAGALTAGSITFLVTRNDLLSTLVAILTHANLSKLERRNRYIISWMAQVPRRELGQSFNAKALLEETVLSLENNDSKN